MPSMFGNLEVRSRLNRAEVKPSTQPDGGEVLAKRKSVVARQGSRQVCSKAVTYPALSKVEGNIPGTFNSPLLGAFLILPALPVVDDFLTDLR